MTAPSIRRATAADAGRVARLFVAARADAMPYLPAPPLDAIAAWMPEVLADEAYVAEVDGEVVAFAALDGDFLAHLYVDPAAQGRGAGSALLERAKAARPAGFRLWVFQRNEAARGFYERRGLRLIEETDGSGNMEREPDALYEWRAGG